MFVLELQAIRRKKESQDEIYRYLILLEIQGASRSSF